MRIEIDNRAGFCRGVKRVIKMAERIMDEKGAVLSLGEIIHNHSESERLMKLGMKVVDYDIFNTPEKYKRDFILIRAHGTPESTFELAEKYGLQVVDGTCPVVTRSQRLVKEYYNKGYQIVIVGKENHPEVIGIQGVCNNEAVVIYEDSDLNKVDFSKMTFILAQTTMPEEKFDKFLNRLKQKVKHLEVKNTICRFVIGRDQQLKEFVRSREVVIMVGGRHSSNTKWLYGVCKNENPNSYWIEQKEEVDFAWFAGVESIGITGSASTPQWLLEEVKEHIENGLKIT